MSLKEAALEYLSKGWSVIPINPTTKGACLPSWKEFQSRLPTDAEVTDWWTKWPWANIGLVTGKLSGVSVVDIDPRHGGTIDNLSGTICSQTGGGGWHYFYQYESRVHSQNSLTQGIDLKSDGGYVILPPSVHKSGNRYKWIKPPFVSKPEPLPQWIVNSQQTSKTSTFDSTLLQGVSEGNRNDSAASVIGKILHGLREDEWDTIAWQLATGWNIRNEPPLDEKELRSVFQSIAHKERISRDKNYDDNKISDDTEKLNSIGDVSFLSFNPKLIKDLTLENAKVEWVWEGYLAKGHSTLFSALWKSGKSTLISQLLKAIQEGKVFAGQKTCISRVLILSEESETMWARRRDELNLNLESWIVSRPIKRRLNYEQWIKLLNESTKFCIEHSVDLLVVDTLTGFWNVQDENSSSFVTSALLPINELLEKNISVLLVHHFRKSGGSEGTAARGSGALGSYVDILIDFSRLDGGNPNDSQRVLRSYSRFEETPPEVVIDMVDGEYVTRGTRAEVSKEARMKNVLFILNDTDLFGLTIKEITENWDTEEFGSRPTKRTIRNYIDALLVDGRIKQVGDKSVGKTKAPVYSVIDKKEGKEISENAGKQEQQNMGFETDNARKERPVS